MQRKPTERVIIIIVTEKREERREKREERREKREERRGERREKREERREGGKAPPCVDSKRLRVCVQDASVCRENACMFNTCGRFPGTHGGVLNAYTEAF